MIGEKVGEVKGVRRGSVLRGELDIAAWIAFFFFFFLRLYTRFVGDNLYFR